jgi:aminopeptidase N
VLDAGSLDYLLAHIEDVPDALTRGSAWVTLWDNMLEKRVTPARFFDAASRAVIGETDEQNAERVLGYLVRTFWRFMSPDERLTRSAALEAMLRNGLQRASSMSLKAAWFNALRDTALGPSSLEWLERVWRRDETVPGLPLAEPDEITLAQELAVRDVPHADAILREQLARTQNPDRKARFAFVLPALSGDPSVRQAAFARFRDVENRRREPWVVESLRYLNHPLRERSAIEFVRPALDMLPEIQRTGDIFFPTRWTESVPLRPSQRRGGVDREGRARLEPALFAAPPLDDSGRGRRSVSRRGLNGVGSHFSRTLPFLFSRECPRKMTPDPISGRREKSSDARRVPQAP